MHLGFLCINSMNWAEMWFEALLCVFCAESDLIAICAIMAQMDAIGLFCINRTDCAQMWL